MPATVRSGSRGPDVKTLQEKLNSQLKPSPNLVPDGDFGGKTNTAVLRFQRTNWLVDDGVVGRATWNALLSAEAYPPILHNPPFIAQPTTTTCWAASTAMITNSSVPAVIARTPSDMILPDGSLANKSEAANMMVDSVRYANAHSLVVIAPTSWLPSALVGMLSRGPLMFDTLWDSQSYTAGTGSPGHMIVVVGIRGDGDESGAATTLRIYDPWPPLQGKVYSVSYGKWVKEVPTRTYRTFHKAKQPFAASPLIDQFI